MKEVIEEIPAVKQIKSIEPSQHKTMKGFKNPLNYNE